jgi:hypothetical protein
MNAITPKTFLRESAQFGILKEAGAIVTIDYEPEDAECRLQLETFLDHLGMTGRPTSVSKLVLALSDLLVAARRAANCLIGWPMKTQDYTSMPYGAAVASSLRDQLLDHGFLKLEQRSSKRDQLAALYLVDLPYDLMGLRFRPHGKGRLVEIRAATKRNEFGQKVRGGLMAEKPFKEELAPLRADMRRINGMMRKYPLRRPDGITFGTCKRIFNGSLRSGGRLYGDWTTLNETERLHCTIAGQPVYEIDLKASFLSISHALVGANSDLPFDPYSEVSFVKSAEDLEDQCRMRKICKKLTCVYLGNGKGTRNFPFGFRDEFSLGKHERVMDYIGPLLDAYPCLRSVPLDSLQLAYVESEIILKAMLALINKDIPTYPVHDCLICRQADLDTVLNALAGSMVWRLGRTISLDVSDTTGVVARYQAKGDVLECLC